MPAFIYNVLTPSGAALIAQATAANPIVWVGALSKATAAASAEDLAVKDKSWYDGKTGEIAAVSATDNVARPVAVWRASGARQAALSLCVTARLASQTDADAVVMSAMSDPDSTIILPGADDTGQTVGMPFPIDINAADSVAVTPGASASLADLERFVSIHKAGDPTAGDSQTILGEKTFSDTLKTRNIEPSWGYPAIGSASRGYDDIYVNKLHVNSLDDFDNGSGVISFKKSLTCGAVGLSIASAGRPVDTFHGYNIRLYDATDREFYCNMSVVYDDNTENQTYINRFFSDSGIWPASQGLQLGDNVSPWGSISVSYCRTNQIGPYGGNATTEVLGHLKPRFSGQVLGDLAHPWASVGADKAVCKSLELTIDPDNGGGALYWDDDNYAIKTNSSILPEDDYNNDLGSSALRWSSVFACDLVGCTPRPTSNIALPPVGTIFLGLIYVTNARLMSVSAGNVVNLNAGPPLPSGVSHIYFAAFYINHGSTNHSVRVFEDTANDWAIDEGKYSVLSGGTNVLYPGDTDYGNYIVALLMRIE